MEKLKIKLLTMLDDEGAVGLFRTSAWPSALAGLCGQFWSRVNYFLHWCFIFTLVLQHQTESSAGAGEVMSPRKVF